jgi:hypothetical protein
MPILLQILLWAAGAGALGYWIWLVSLARRQISLCTELVERWGRTPESVRKALPEIRMPGFVASLVLPKKSFFRALGCAREIVEATTAKRSYPGAPDSDDLEKLLEREQRLCARPLLSFSSFNNLDHGPNGLYGIAVSSAYCGTCESQLININSGIIAGQPRQVLWCRRCMKLGSKGLASRL